jgi:hypothetical protein
VPNFLNVLKVLCGAGRQRSFGAHLGEPRRSPELSLLEAYRFVREDGGTRPDPSANAYGAGSPYIWLAIYRGADIGPNRL